MLQIYDFELHMSHDPNFLAILPRILARIRISRIQVIALNGIERCVIGPEVLEEQEERVL
jgi:hypothetical protein